MGSFASSSHGQLQNIACSHLHTGMDRTHFQAPQSSTPLYHSFQNAPHTRTVSTNAQGHDDTLASRALGPQFSRPNPPDFSSFYSHQQALGYFPSFPATHNHIVGRNVFESPNSVFQSPNSSYSAYPSPLPASVYSPFNSIQFGLHMQGAQSSQAFTVSHNSTQPSSSSNSHEASNTSKASRKRSSHAGGNSATGKAKRRISMSATTANEATEQQSMPSSINNDHSQTQDSAVHTRSENPEIDSNSQAAATIQRQHRYIIGAGGNQVKTRVSFYMEKRHMYRGTLNNPIQLYELLPHTLRVIAHLLVMYGVYVSDVQPPTPDEVKTL